MKFRKFVENITPNKSRLAIFDMDGTLLFTPSPEEGIPAYEKATGKPWVIKDKTTAIQHGFPANFKRLGWWGRPETLHPPVFTPTPDKLNPAVAQAFHHFRQDPNTYVVMMTGRGANNENRVREILNSYGIHADEYYLRGQKSLTKDKDYPHAGDTFDYKAFVIINRLMNENIKILEIFDDREEHIVKFVSLGKSLKEKWPNLQSVLVHDVQQNKNYSL